MMKRIFVPIQMGLMLFLCSFTITQGQIRLGVKAGMNVNNQQVNKMLIDNSTASIGFNVGLLAEIDLSSKFYLRPELLYSQKGWTATEIQQSFPTFQSRMRLHYVTLPLSIGYRIIPTLSVSTGVEMGYLIHASFSPQSIIDVNDYYNKPDLGITLGSAFNFSSQLGLEIRYIYGLTPIITADLRDPNGNTIWAYKSGYNRVLQAGLFYRFGQKQ